MLSVTPANLCPRDDGLTERKPVLVERDSAQKSITSTAAAAGMKNRVLSPAWPLASPNSPRAGRPLSRNLPKEREPRHALFLR
jgi:hypothetical protein